MRGRRTGRVATGTGASLPSPGELARILRLPLDSEELLAPGRFRALLGRLRPFHEAIGAALAERLGPGWAGGEAPREGPKSGSVRNKVGARQFVSCWVYGREPFWLEVTVNVPLWEGANPSRLGEAFRRPKRPEIGISPG